MFRRETRVERGGFCGGRPASGGCPRAWAAASTRYGGRGIQTTRSSADSSDDVVKNESGGPSAAALNLPWYRLELLRGADGTDLAGRSSRLAGRDGDELDVYGRADYARPRARGRERPHQYRAAASESSLRLAVASELRRSRRSGRNQEKKVMLPHYQYSYNVPGSRSGIKICRVIFLLVIILTRRPCLRLTLRSTCTVFDLEMTT